MNLVSSGNKMMRGLKYIFVTLLGLFSLAIQAGGSAPVPAPTSAVPVTNPTSSLEAVPSPPAVKATPPAEPVPDYHAGEAAYDAGDYEKARDIWMTLAEKGHLRAIYGIGKLYEKGRGVRKNYTEAVKWYRRGADKGHADCQYRLSVGYAYGLGVKKNEAEAFAWLRKAATNGQKRAQRSLAKAYEDGLFGVPRDPEQAKYWYDRANSDS